MLHRKSKYPPIKRPHKTVLKKKELFSFLHVYMIWKWDKNLLFFFSPPPVWKEVCAYWTSSTSLNTDVTHCTRTGWQLCTDMQQTKSITHHISNGFFSSRLNLCILHWILHSKKSNWSTQFLSFLSVFDLELCLQHTFHTEAWKGFLRLL